jgi:hypothetical protein
MATRWRVLNRRRIRKANSQPYTPFVSVHYFEDLYRYGYPDEPEYEDCDHDEDYDGDCWHCGGDGYVDGYEDDPINNCEGEYVRCSSCYGSGRSKDMTIW